MADYARRLTKVQSLMTAKQVDYLLLTASPNTFYLTGISTIYDERMQLYMVPASGGMIFILPAMIRDFIEGLNQGEWETHYWVDGQRPAELLADYCRNPRRVAVDDMLRTQHFLQIMPFLRGAELIAADEIMKECRIFKGEGEIALLKQAGQLVDEVMEEIQPFLREGVYEQEIAVKIEFMCKNKGAEATSFNPIIAFGPNGANPHPGYTKEPLAKGQFITMDFGARLGNYCSDTTRTMCLGKATDEMKRIYEAVLAANRAGFAAARLGAACQDVDKAARDVITAAGYGPNFLHRTGHGIGIELHEEPYMVAGNQRPLEAGMTFSVEPGIYLAGRLGVRIEDIVVATPEGPLSMNDYPRELIQL